MKYEHVLGRSRIRRNHGSGNRQAFLTNHGDARVDPHILLHMGAASITEVSLANQDIYDAAMFIYTVSLRSNILIDGMVCLVLAYIKIVVPNTYCSVV